MSPATLLLLQLVVVLVTVRICGWIARRGAGASLPADGGVVRP